MFALELMPFTHGLPADVQVVDPAVRSQTALTGSAVTVTEVAPAVTVRLSDFH